MAIHSTILAWEIPWTEESGGLQSIGLLYLWGFSRQEYWRGLLGSPPGDLLDPGIEPRSLALQADSLLSEPPGT